VRAAILTVGSEITTGRIADTNAQWVSGRLLGIGITTGVMLSVDDVGEDIAAALRTALSWGELVWVTGGMGPTADDITVSTLAGALGLSMVEDPGTASRVKEWYSRRGTPPSRESLRQAQVPAGARVFANPVGSAPGLIVEAGGRTVVMLPGVPAEMKALAEGFILPALAGRGIPTETRIFKMAGVPESVVDARVRDVWKGLGPGETLALQIESGEVFLRAKVSGPDGARAAARMGELEAALRARLGPDLYATGDETLEGAVVARLKAMNSTLATAESVTGGMLASRIVAVPGASGVFVGGLVAYGEGEKTRMLGVPGELIASHGAVSPETASAMASAARKVTGADWVVATTGYAGPGGATERGATERGATERGATERGATERDPVGTVYLALEGPGVATVERRWFRGERNTVRTYAVTHALEILRRGLGS
jgi:nicotinamide-nucleotide amidase